MEKLPLGERPFQAKHERARCGKAQQSLRTGLERQACWICWTTRAEVPAALLCSLAVLGPRWGLCSELAGAHLLVCCIHLGWQMCVLWLWLPLHLDYGKVAVSSMPHHPCCSCVEEGDPQRVYNIFQFLMIPEGQCKWEELSCLEGPKH